MPLVTLDFNAVVYSISGDPLATRNGNILEDGFTVDNLNAASGDFGTLRSSNGYNRHDTNDDVPTVTFQGFVNGQPTGTSAIRITKDDGAIFDLVSLQLDTRDTGGGGTATITGLKSDGVTTVQHVVNLDTILSLQTFTLPDTFRDLVRFDVEGPVNFQFNDIILRTYIQGTAGADTLNVVDATDVAYRALGGADTINFGTFFSNGDIVDGGTGTDTISFSGGLTATLGSGTVQNITNVEILKLLSGSYNLTMANIFVASGQTLTVDASALTAGQTLTLNGAAETNGKFAITGGIDADTLTGGSGDDLLNGNSGADSMTGGLGNDTYYIDIGGDVIVEAVGQGNDKAFASAGYILGAGVELEILSASDNAGTGALDLYGNDLANQLWGNNGANLLGGNGGSDVLFGFGGDDGLIGGDGSDYLDGGAQNDGLYGGAGDDTLVGGGGNDYLDGGTGADGITGGTGDDFYVFDNGGDFALENAGEGRDTVLTTVTSLLVAGTELENLWVLNSASTNTVDLYGNDFANELLGNNGVNLLSGAGGNDSLVGFAGNDSLLGGEGGDYLVGGAGGDYLVGGAGNDLIVSGEGNDYIEPGTGFDFILFDAALTAGNADTIVGFSAADDTIQLSAAIFTGLALGALAPGAFVVGTAAADANDRIIYNNATGGLFFDPDGNGANPFFFIGTLQGAPTISAADFTVI